MNNRLDYIDYIKGFAIILMVYGHLDVVEESPIKSWIYSFHMPLFFVVAGLLTAHRLQKGKDLSPLDILQKRVLQLGIPYFVWSIADALFLSGMSILGGEMPKIQEYVWLILSLHGMGSLWFIPCYVIAECILAATVKYGKWIALLPVAGFVFLYLGNTDLPVLTRACMGYMMMLFGYYISIYKIYERVPLWSIFVLLLSGTLINHFDGRYDLSSLTFGHLWLYVLTWMLMTPALVSLFYRLSLTQKCLKVKRLLSYWGGGLYSAIMYAQSLDRGFKTLGLQTATFYGDKFRLFRMHYKYHPCSTPYNPYCTFDKNQV